MPNRRNRPRLDPVGTLVRMVPTSPDPKVQRGLGPSSLDGGVCHPRAIDDESRALGRGTSFGAT